MIPYWLYITVCWITHPFRWVMFFWGDADFKFAVKMLFYNEYKCAFVNCQSRLETGDFKSKLCVSYNNYFGMGYSKNSPYQAHGTDNKPTPGEPSSFAIYKSVYNSVYDYYYWVKKHTTLDKVMNTFPSAEFQNQSYELQQYVSTLVGYFKANGYFTATAQGYAGGIWQNMYDDYSTYTWRYYLNYIYAIGLPCWVLTAVRNRNNSNSLLSKIKKAIKK